MQISVEVDQVPSPLKDAGAVQYEMRKLPLSFRNSAYAGDPNPDIDLAWHNLFEDANFQIDGSDLERLNLTSVPLSDGGYVAQLGVYHELHCIKKIWQWVFKEYYVLNRGLSQAELDEWPPHINHCVEMLRFSAMCRGDTSISTFRWMNVNGRRFATAADRGPRKCVKWEPLAAWVKERSVDITKPGVLLDET
ncbi:MAG: hypothetical protein M1822_004436 [Bathelium mastoideum]|nr:MAG: hypothetical protein M1822_004436 [Bathelium mastoideum]